MLLDLVSRLLCLAYTYPGVRVAEASFLSLPCKYLEAECPIAENKTIDSFSMLHTTKSC